MPSVQSTLPTLVSVTASAKGSEGAHGRSGRGCRAETDRGLATDGACRRVSPRPSSIPRASGPGAARATRPPRPSGEGVRSSIGAAPTPSRVREPHGVRGGLSEDERERDVCQRILTTLASPSDRQPRPGQPSRTSTRDGSRGCRHGREIQGRHDPAWARGARHYVVEDGAQGTEAIEAGKVDGQRRGRDALRSRSRTRVTHRAAGRRGPLRSWVDHRSGGLISSPIWWPIGSPIRTPTPRPPRLRSSGEGESLPTVGPCGPRRRPTCRGSSELRALDEAAAWSGDGEVDPVSVESVVTGRRRGRAARSSRSTTTARCGPGSSSRTGPVDGPCHPHRRRDIEGPGVGGGGVQRLGPGRGDLLGAAARHTADPARRLPSPTTPRRRAGWPTPGYTCRRTWLHMTRPVAKGEAGHHPPRRDGAHRAGSTPTAYRSRRTCRPSTRSRGEPPGPLQLLPRDLPGVLQRLAEDPPPLGPLVAGLRGRRGRRGDRGRPRTAQAPSALAGALVSSVLLPDADGVRAACRPPSASIVGRAGGRGQGVAVDRPRGRRRARPQTGRPRSRRDSPTRADELYTALAGEPTT